MKALVAQLVCESLEYVTFNLGVVGSSPTERTSELRHGVTVAQRSLEPLVQVRILVPQLKGATQQEVKPRGNAILVKPRFSSP